ncbi:hypothetical protein QJS04_geneDACA015892 [Acorus gramineus]|uniref:Secreted protein n=1 Tax=Acorus gramineus TaxID=55184 RepID=A0AAV9BMU0_ACOGR|nr:hypothetical protein QJS04_geneDACA015892 [Acorus gramineus]
MVAWVLLAVDWVIHPTFLFDSIIRCYASFPPWPLDSRIRPPPPPRPPQLPHLHGRQMRRSLKRVQTVRRYV